MTLPILPALLPAAAKFFASNGLNLLAGIFGKRLAGEKLRKVAGQLKEATGINLADLAGGKVTKEQLLQLKQFEMDHEPILLDYLTELQKLELEQEKTAQEDRAGARTMQKTALAQEDLLAKRFIYGYATLVTLITFSYIFFVTFSKVPEGNNRIVDTVLGFLLGVSLSAIIQFFFGSSKSSADKQAKINELVEEVRRFRFMD